MENYGGGSSSNEQYTSADASGNQKKNRHSPLKIQRLEAFFKECPHPDEFQRLELCKELNLELDQIKFWFQNKRTQLKTQEERANNLVLHGVNERLKCENEAMLEALRTLFCPACGPPPFGREECEPNLQKLRLENARLRDQRDQISSNYMSKNMSKRPMLDSSGYVPSNVVEATTSEAIQPLLSQLDIFQLSEIGAIAVEELKPLFLTDEQFWIKSPIDGTDVIDQANYQKFFHAIKHFNGSNARLESSIDGTVVPIEATNLIEIFFDSEKWKEVFGTIVNKTKTFHVLRPDLTIRENCNYLQVMWEQLHILSPLVTPREFMIVRCCQEIQKGLWIIADVSNHRFNFDLANASCYKRPSGCLIQALPNAHSRVMWIEHVEVDDKLDTHQMYREVVGGELGYGAKRWIVTLERMCERMAFSSRPTIPLAEWNPVIPTLEGRWNVMKLGERMLMNFKEMLTMSEKLDFVKQSNSGMRVSMRVNEEEIGQPPGIVVAAAISFSIPLTPLQVFAVLQNTRPQWDILFFGTEVSEIARIKTGSSETNCVTILRPTNMDNNGKEVIAQGLDKDVVLQDSYMDALGGMLVYAPLDVHLMNMAVSAPVNPANIPILPSGFIISRDGRRSTVEEGGGTILTIALQILASSNANRSREVNEQSVNTVSGLISSTVQKIKTVFSCPE